MLGTAREVNTVRAQFDEEENIDRFQPQSFDREKVTSPHLVVIIAQEGAPSSLWLSLWCW